MGWAPIRRSNEVQVQNRPADKTSYLRDSALDRAGTGNLSSKVGEEIIALLKNMRDRLGTAVLLVTHNPRDAAAGDRVLFLHDGTMNPDSALVGGGFGAADIFRRLEELGI